MKYKLIEVNICRKKETAIIKLGKKGKTRPSKRRRLIVYKEKSSLRTSMKHRDLEEFLMSHGEKNHNFHKKQCLENPWQNF